MISLGMFGGAVPKEMANATVTRPRNDKFRNLSNAGYRFYLPPYTVVLTEVANSDMR